MILSSFPQSSGCQPGGQESHRLSQHTTVPAWSRHCNKGTDVLPPQLAGLGMREEKQACRSVRGVLQTLTYPEQREFQKNIPKPCRTKLETWHNCKILCNSSKESNNATWGEVGVKAKQRLERCFGCVRDGNSVSPWPK